VVARNHTRRADAKAHGPEAKDHSGDPVAPARRHRRLSRSLAGLDGLPARAALVAGRHDLLAV
jgi:hypothetical protein